MCGTQINMRKHDSWQRYTFVSVIIRSQRSSSIFIMHILCLCSLWSLIFLTPKFKIILMDNLEVQSKNRFALEFEILFVVCTESYKFWHRLLRTF